jgi:hypothetical protein
MRTLNMSLSSSRPSERFAAATIAKHGSAVQDKPHDQHAAADERDPPTQPAWKDDRARDNAG